MPPEALRAKGGPVVWMNELRMASQPLTLAIERVSYGCLAM
jgi:hypothetical protein